MVGIKKVHKALKINQEKWPKLNIDLNTNLKAKAESKFEEDFYKLMNNNVYGKTLENFRKYCDVNLVTTDERWKYLASEPNYKTTKWFSEI